MIEISDYWIAAYIVASGVKLLGTKRSEDGWTTFTFGKDANKAIGRWRNGRAMIDARAYRSAIRKLRNTLH